MIVGFSNRAGRKYRWGERRREEDCPGFDPVDRSDPAGTGWSGGPATVTVGIHRVAAGDGHAAWPLNIYRAGHRLPSPGVLAVDHRHLYCLLTIHDLLQRRGVAAAFDLLTTAEIADALDACA